ncbi:MAG: AzlD domain-containing protein [Acutalibacteraceae bacterium]|nr:AzlD domain-containing protein [Acutalibacteraceae bacterium]
MTDKHYWISLAIMVFVTALLRFLPFMVFGGKRKTPAIIEKLGRTLPFAVMGMLVIYCLKDVSFTAVSGFLPQLIGCLVTGLLYVWKKNTLLSILVGTVSYMLLVQFVF